MGASIQWVDPHSPLPDAHLALTDPPGLVAASMDLSVARLREAYSKGIFPWYGAGDPVLWWSPDPRTVLVCEQMHVSHSLAKRLRQIARKQQAGDLNSCVVTIDCAFDAVLDACASRGTSDPDATWITPQMKQVYKQWHALGHVHSVETWLDGQLAGGLYGVSLGRMFFGESMFTLRTDASKIALFHLVRFLQRHSVTLIDCQMRTDHLLSLGAREISRHQFIEHVSVATREPDIEWKRGWVDHEGQLHWPAPRVTHAA